MRVITFTLYQSLIALVKVMFKMKGRAAGVDK